jgi:hypothetical protein
LTGNAALTWLMSAVAGLAAGASTAFAAGADIGVPNSEDLAPSADGRWVFAGSMPGGPVTAGSLSVIDARSGKVRRLYPDAAATGRSTVDGCPAETRSFAPHGLALSPAGDRLYVVNHGGRESIEMFQVVAGPSPSLRWIGCVVGPAGLDLNSVAATRDGTLFVTAIKPPADLQDFPTTPGKVLTWRAASGWREVAGGEVITPNGILATPDGATLYVDSYAPGEVIELTLGPSGAARRTVKLGFMTDNVRWGRRGMLTVAGQRAPFMDIARCYQSKASVCDIASAMAEIDRANLSVRCQRPADLSFATTAVPVGAEIWLSSLRGDAIRRLGGDAFAKATCE